MRRLICWWRGHDWTKWKASQKMNNIFEITRRCRRCDEGERQRVGYEKWINNL